MVELKQELLRQRAQEEKYLCHCPSQTKQPLQPHPTSPPDLLWGWRPSDLERWARIVFPLIFLTFHFVYWTILINISERSTDDLMPLKDD